MPHLPPSSLIICTRNRFELLNDTIASILEADEMPSELIIVDQSDVPGPFLNDLAKGKECDIRHIYIKNVGSSHARNTGVSLAKHEILIFIDDDMFVTADWLCKLIQTLLHYGPRSAVTGRVLAAPAEKPGQIVIAVDDWTEPQVHQGRIQKDVLASGLMAIYRSAFQEVGGFDERLGPGTRFPAAEDNDLGFRLLEAGCKIIFTPDSVIYHRAWRTKRNYVPMYWNYGSGQGAFYAKHWSWRDRYMLSRAWNDAARYFKLLPRRLWRRQLLVLSGSTAFLLGEFMGALRWFLSGNGGAP